MDETNIYPNVDIPRMRKRGLYDPAFEHDACGVGLVANIDGAKSHKVIEQGLEVLINLGHRGALGADPETGDGAGILIQMPHNFLSKECQKLNIHLPPPGQYGVGTLFLPRQDSERSRIEKTVELTIEAEGLNVLGWRDVPVNPKSIGILANKVRPQIRQIFIEGKETHLPLEIKLYITRRQIEKQISNDEFYICNLSTNRLVYKGLLIANQLENFFPDLKDPTMSTAFALVHSRFSTNTLGSWSLAHPYRYIIHNGEINTLRGNTNWMRARESKISSAFLGDEVKKLLPIISKNQSDTASLDNVLELLLASGRSIEHSMMMLIPEAWASHIPMEKDLKSFYEYHSTLMEPWDGPALVIGTDGTKVCAILDRNGLRPCRYLITKDDLLVMASETGVLDIDPSKIVKKWRIEPGRMFLLDTEKGRIVDDSEIKKEVCNRKPYSQWLFDNKIHIDDLPEPKPPRNSAPKTLPTQHLAFGYTGEDLKMIIEPMASSGVEPVGSMGNDSPIAVLSNQNPLLYNYFKQMFAQVSNPPLDAIREELVTSLESFIGAESNLFEETPQHCNQLKLDEPILSNLELEKIRHISAENLKSATIPTLFEISEKHGCLKKAMDSMCKRAVQAVEQGYSILILSDRGVDEKRVPIPALLATAAVNHHLIRQGLRTNVGIVVESGEPREVAHFSLLFGYGAGAINPYLALETAVSLGNQETSIDYTENANRENEFIHAIHKGVLKVMSKMGISTLQSYRGAQIFEAIGLNKEFVAEYFTGTPSRIGGIGLDKIEKDSLDRHAKAYLNHNLTSSQDIPLGSFYQWRRNGEHHMWNPESISKLQYASSKNDKNEFRKFTNYVDTQNQNYGTIRGLLDFKYSNRPISIGEVEPVENIVTRFATGAASLGSISLEAHETMAIAMNRIGARSNTGEGGEDPGRYMPDNNGDSRSSAIKQVASGRFGVTIGYLTNATDIQIKMAQGSKPGEGGQLPGHKVDNYIGWVRNSTPGVELISPPPHHDIYSIEDLAQLIFDLKNSNPEARIHVKLVAEVGVGTIAAGVSKGHADVVLISGDSGGTGASPESSIKHAGIPWELGLAETHQVLVSNDLRGRIVVQTDGQLKTGRDIAIACLLGAEEFGLATAPLITMGCVMLRKCHLNTCSVGIATQDPQLRKMFAGQPEHLINYFLYLAEELREIMANLGFKTVNDMVGRTDKLHVGSAIDHWQDRGLDCSALLDRPNVPDSVSTYHSQPQDHKLSKILDRKLIAKSLKRIQEQRPVEISTTISNSNRATGTMLSHEVTKRFGENGLVDDSIKINLTGSAGQSFAAFLSKGITMNLKGDANDYFCKGISGGKVIITPQDESTLFPEQNIIIGNVALYGATSGQVFIQGIAGERFAVRNSGAEAVVEGVGDHGCEYMTRGRVVVLGKTGRNFAAGMSGGEVFIFDQTGSFHTFCNPGMVSLEKVERQQDVEALKRLVTDHKQYTNSLLATQILDKWDESIMRFVKVMPHDLKHIVEN